MALMLKSPPAGRYVHKLLTGAEWEVCCHANLVRAVLPYCLHESDIHDVLNVFQVTGLTPEGHQYFVKPCPAQVGDYFEFFAEIDLLCALSACPHGDMFVATWGPQAGDPLAVCRPLGVEVYRVESALLHGWHASLVASYQGTHGMQLAEASVPCEPFSRHGRTTPQTSSRWWL